MNTDKKNGYTRITVLRKRVFDGTGFKQVVEYVPPEELTKLVGLKVIKSVGSGRALHYILD